MYRKWVLISIGLWFTIILILYPLNSLDSIKPSGTIGNSVSTLSPPLNSASTTPLYELLMPITYDLEGQTVSVVGDVGSLSQENSVMYFWQSFSSMSTGATYVVYTFSTAGFAINTNYSLTLNWEVMGFGTVAGLASLTIINFSIWYQNSVWREIHSVSTPDHVIDRTYGWAEYVLPRPYEDYITGNELKVKIEIDQQLFQSQDWYQYLYIQWLLLEIEEHTAMNTLNATAIHVISEGYDSSGCFNDLNLEDDSSFILERTTLPSDEVGQIQFNITYDLGYYDLEPAIGLRFSHLDWFEFTGTSGSWLSNIYIIGQAGTSFLCYGRDKHNDPISPAIQHAISPILGDWILNGSITLLYNIQYSISDCTEVKFFVDWAQIQLVRAPNPIVLTNTLNTTIYAQQEFWLNITCLDGKAPITEIQLQPWNELIGTSAGSYLHAQYVDAAGEITPSLIIIDADGDHYTRDLPAFTVLHRPITIALYLSEASESSELVIQLSIKDIFSNQPLGLYPFTKTILKNGSWFRQQLHQTTLDGGFEIHEDLIDYLDWNYTVIIETQETTVYGPAVVYSQKVMAECPPYLSIDTINYETPLKANDQIELTYTVTCHTAVQTLLLLKNGSLFRTLPTVLGRHHYTFQDVGGSWEYRLYANNSRGFQGFSNLFKLTIIPLETHIELDSELNVNDHAIILDVQLLDELNRSCLGVPLQITIHDHGKVFYTQEVTTGLNGVYLMVHFDQYRDHSFTLTITSESTPLYEGSIASADGLFYEGYPLYSIIGVGVAIGTISIILSLIRKRLRNQRV